MTSLDARLAKVKEAIGAVGKDSKMTEGPAKYAYRGIDAVLSAAHQALIDNEVVIAPVRVVKDYEARESKSGTKGIWASFTVTFVVRGGGESFELETVGEALDWSDKSSNKAQTAAQKVAICQLFAIPYGGDDPDHEHPESAQRSSGGDVDKLQAEVDALPDANRARLLTEASKAADWDVKSVGDLPTTWHGWWRKAIDVESKLTSREVPSQTSPADGPVDDPGSSATPAPEVPAVPEAPSPPASGTAPVAMDDATRQNLLADIAELPAEMSTKALAQIESQFGPADQWWELQLEDIETIIANAKADALPDPEPSKPEAPPKPLKSEGKSSPKVAYEALGQVVAKRIDMPFDEMTKALAAIHSGDGTDTTTGFKVADWTRMLDMAGRINKGERLVEDMSTPATWAIVPVELSEATR